MVDNSLSNKEIDIILKNYKRFGGCYSKDNLPELKTNYYYIINLEDSDAGSGTHWTCLYMKDDDFGIYFDPMSYPPPKNLDDMITTILWNPVQIQDINSTACGYYCIVFIKISYNMDNKIKSLSFINDLFSNNTKKNDKILLELLNYD